MKLTQREYNSFPAKFEITNKVFQYYFKKGYKGGKIAGLSEPQSALCYFFICEGLIDNGGFYALLLETEGHFNKGYIAALNEAGATQSKKILEEMHIIYEQYKSSFSKANLPPVLDDGSKKFDKKLDSQINRAQKKWYRLSGKRTEQMNNYFSKNKDALIKIK